MRASTATRSGSAGMTRSRSVLEGPICSRDTISPVDAWYLAQAQVSQLEEFLDAGAGAAQHLDGGPGPEGVVLETFGVEPRSGLVGPGDVEGAPDCHLLCSRLALW